MSAVRRAAILLNSDLRDDAFEDVLRKLKHPVGAKLEASNRSFRHMLVNGVTVEYR